VNDMDLLASFRASVPEAPVSPQAEARFQQALRRPERRSPLHRAPALSRRVRLLLLAPVAAGAAAAVALALLPGTAPAPTPVRAPGAALTVKLLADKAANVALQQPSVSPSQWVFRQIAYLVSPSRLKHPGTVVLWETADGARGDDVGPLLLGVSAPSVSVPDSIPYADLGSAPSNPAALWQYLASRQPDMPGASPGVKAFEAIESILAQYVVSPGLTAELYQALADIPGVTVNEHAQNVVGQPGVAFALSGNWLSEIILDPHTDAFIGMQGKIGAEGPGNSVTWSAYQVAILREAPVSGDGVMP
jgi:hypothetical protein